MKIFLTFISIAALLNGCVSIKPVTLPGGAKGFALECDHAADCLNKAAKACAPATYEIIDKGAKTEGVMVGLMASSSETSTLVVRCNSK